MTCSSCGKVVYVYGRHRYHNPKYHCNCSGHKGHDKNICSKKPPEVKELAEPLSLRCFNGKERIVHVIGDDGVPCWYRCLDIAEGDPLPPEDTPRIIYDCLGRVWELQEPKNAEDIAALEADIAALAATVAALPEERHVTGFELDATTGVASLIFNTGAPVTGTVVNPVVVTGTQTPSGTNVIPLIGGGSLTLIAPPGSTQTSAVDADGNITITHTSGDGTVNETTIPFDEMLGGLAPAADGCTLTGTLDDGTAVSVPLCDLVSELTSATVAGVTTITHTSGNGDTFSFDLPVMDVTAALGVGHPGVDGLSLGQVNKPTNIARISTDFSGADPRLEVSYRSMQQLMSNRAAEQIVSAGMMNSDGSLGHYAKRITISVGGTPIDASENGGWIYVEAVSGGQVTPLAAPRYAGQIVYIHARSASADETFFTDIISAVNVVGVARNPSNDSLGTNRPGFTDQMRLRNGESVVLIAQSTGVWRVHASSYSLLRGPNYRENEDGTYTIWGSGSSAVFPFALSNTSYFTSGPNSAKTLTGFTNNDGGDWIVEGAVRA